MAQQIKKKYIENNAVDGAKLKLLQGQSVRAVNSSGTEIDLIKLSATDQILVNNEEVALKSEVAAEAILRQAADNSLQSQINNIASNIDPAALDSLTEIVAAFQAADADINNAISSLGTGSSSALSQEIIDRQLADAALDVRVQELESVTWGQQKTTVDATVISNGYIDLSVEIVPGSMHASVDRLIIHEGAAEDYIVATVSGVSRVTFQNNMIGASEQALSIGDSIYLKYQYKN